MDRVWNNSLTAAEFQVAGYRLLLQNISNSQMMSGSKSSVYGRVIVEQLDKLWGLVLLCVGLVRVLELQRGHVKYTYPLWPRVHRLRARIRPSGKEGVIARIYASYYDHLICVCGMTSMESS